LLSILSILGELSHIFLLDNLIKKLLSTVVSSNNSDEMIKNFVEKQLPEIQSRIKQSILNKYEKESKILNKPDFDYLYNELFYR
jgi:hypothetical protein